MVILIKYIIIHEFSSDMFHTNTESVKACVLINTTKKPKAWKSVVDPNNHNRTYIVDL